jgi:hypothetical protein
METDVAVSVIPVSGLSPASLHWAHTKMAYGYFQTTKPQPVVAWTQPTDYNGTTSQAIPATKLHNIHHTTACSVHRCIGASSRVVPFHFNQACCFS